jgi:D-alanine-D-alanine ligase
MGGRSAEREVSLVSGRECAAALRQKAFDVEEIDAGQDVRACSRARSPTSPSTRCTAAGARTAASRACSNGCASPTPIRACWPRRSPWTRAGQGGLRRGRAAGGRGPRGARDGAPAHPMAPPYVVKPVNEGSSVGVYLVPRGGERARAARRRRCPRRCWSNAFVPGRELTVSGDGRPAAGGHRHHRRGLVRLPRQVRRRAARATSCRRRSRPRWTAACLAHALTAHRALGCRGPQPVRLPLGRARGLGGLVHPRVNTQPGMTPTSLAPEQAAHHGIGFGALVRWMVEDASCSR